MFTDGACVNRSMLKLLSDKIPAIIGHIDDGHQLQRALVDGFSTASANADVAAFYKSFLSALRTTIAVCTRSDVAVMAVLATCGLQNGHLSKLFDIRWCQGWISSLDSLDSKFCGAMTVLAQRSSGKSTTPSDPLVSPKSVASAHQLLTSLKGLAFLKGFRDILAIINEVQLDAQRADSALDSRKHILLKVSALKGDPIDGLHFQTMLQQVNKSKQEFGQHQYKGIKMHGSTAPGRLLIKTARESVMRSISKRLQDTPFIKLISIFDFSTWPVDDLPKFGMQEIVDLGRLWEGEAMRLANTSLAGVENEFLWVKENELGWRTDPPPRQLDFWATIIQRQAQFPRLHIVLRRR